MTTSRIDRADGSAPVMQDGTVFPNGPTVKGAGGTRRGTMMHTDGGSASATVPPRDLGPADGRSTDAGDSVLRP
jgi:hypothetical protein